MIRYRAAWVLPISAPPIRDGWVSVADGRIVACGAGRDGMEVAPEAREVDLGEVAILPGLVNAHTHIELSYLRGEVAPAADFVTWIRTLLAVRGRRPDTGSPVVLEGIERGLAESIASGTAVVGDISNTLATFEPLARSRLSAVLFYELVRFGAADAPLFVEKARSRIEALGPTPRVRVSLAAHAPCSVAPAVFRAIREAIDRDHLGPCSVHLAESPEEIEFMRTAGGPWRQLLAELGAWDEEFSAPGVTPVEFLDDFGFLDDRMLAVHGVQMTPADLARLAARGTTLVTCPRSNKHTGAGLPPIEAFYASGVHVAVGTDSLASAPDLNVFAELAAMRALAPSVPATRLLASATYEGARALAFDDEYGTITPGKAARLLRVDVPADTEDVEEYLVSGIHPEQVRWIEP